METMRIRSKIGSDGHLKVDVPTTLPQGDVDVVVVLAPVPSNGKPKKYDFSDLAGKLKWNGDAVALQRKLRDEW